MSRWGVAAVAIAVAVVLAIGMVAIRVSDRDLADDDPAPAEPTTAPDDDSTRTGGDPADDPSGNHPVARRPEPGDGPVHTQLWRLKRWLERKGRLDDGAEFFVTVSLRKPLPLRIADRRRSPVPDGLPASTEYSLYAEPGDGTMFKARTDDLGDTASLHVPTAELRKRLVVLGWSMSADDYPDAKAALRTLPIGARVVGTAPRRAEYLSGRVFNNRALRAWNRYYRRI